MCSFVIYYIILDRRPASSVPAIAEIADRRRETRPWAQRARSRGAKFTQAQPPRGRGAAHQDARNTPRARALRGGPLGHLLGPWILWLFWRRHASTLDANGRAALNFALTISIFYVSALILVFFFVGFILLGILIAIHIIVLVRNGWRTSVNLPAHYPLTINFLS